MKTGIGTAANQNNNPCHIAYGEKYQRGMDVAEIAKRIRGDIKAAVRVGRLPIARYSVRIERYSMGRSVNVTLDQVPFQIPNEARVRRDVFEPYTFHPVELLLHSEEARALLAAVEDIVKAYNFDGSDSQSDHFNVNFYSDVTFATKQYCDQREAMAARFQQEKKEAQS
jgi:hypothetical protein